MTKLEYTHALRNNPTCPCNCCQAVLVTYAVECGLTEAQARGLGSQFNAGMRMGSVCGAISGGLMTLGLMGAGDAAARSLVQHFRTSHGAVNCAELLKLDRERGNTDKKSHCDGLIYESVAMLEELLTEKA